MLRPSLMLSVTMSALMSRVEDAIAAAMTGLLQQGETPSVLINNAGAAYTGELLAMPIERWQWLLQLNVTSVMQVCSAVVPSMRENGGLVINISSHAARNAFPQWGAYCVSKAALATQASQAQNQELARSKIARSKINK